MRRTMNPAASGPDRSTSVPRWSHRARGSDRVADGEVARDAVFYRDWARDLPDEMATIVVHRKLPSLPMIPSELHGRPAMMVACCWAGDLESGEKVMAPMRRFGTSIVDLCAPKPFLARQA